MTKEVHEQSNETAFTAVSVEDLLKHRLMPPLDGGSPDYELDSSYSQTRTYEKNVLEYGNDKWGRALTAIEQGRLKTLADVDRFFVGEGERLGLVRGEICTGPGLIIHKLYMREMLDEITSSWRGEPLIDLGAGYGGFAIRLAEERGGRFPSGRVQSAVDLALELTETGRRCIELLTPPQISLGVGKCDFYQDPIFEGPLPENAFILTSFSLACLSQTPDHLLDSLINSRPSKVCHVEPVYPSAPRNTLEEVRRAYAVKNGYNLDIWDTLVAGEASGRLKILSIQEARNTTNALFVPSIVIWRPL